MTRKPLYRRRWVHALVTVLFLAVITIELWPPRSAPGPAPLGRTPEAVERELVARLPIGSPLDSAIALFKRTNIAHSIGDAPRDYIGPPHLAGGPTVRAIEREVDSDWLVSESIEIVLTYNADRRLIHHSVKSVFTGP